MEFVALILAVPATLLASCIYIAMLAAALRVLPGIARPLAAGSAIALACVAIELVFLACYGPLETYARLGRPYVAIHFIAFFLGPPAAANLAYLALMRMKRPMWSSIVAALALCWPASMIAVGMNFWVDEGIVGVDAGRPFYMVPPPPVALTAARRAAYEDVLEFRNGTALALRAKALERLWAAGTDAFPALLAHLDDTRPIPFDLYGGDWGSTNGAVDLPLGVICFDLLQTQIEGNWPKAYRGAEILTPANIEQWLAAHDGASLAELRAAAARDELAAVERQIAANGATEYLEDLRAFFEERVKESAKKPAP
ncbi:MAG: hypothetical protein U0625_00210 [Phycisphaerales bacterium]